MCVCVGEISQIGMGHGTIDNFKWILFQYVLYEHKRMDLHFLLYGDCLAYHALIMKNWIGDSYIYL